MKGNIGAAQAFTSSRRCSCPRSYTRHIHLVGVGAPLRGVVVGVGYRLFTGSCGAGARMGTSSSKENAMEALLGALVILVVAALLPRLEYSHQRHCSGYCHQHGCYCNFRAGHEGDCSHFCAAGHHWF